DLAATPGAVMPASYEVPIVDADATGPANGELAPIIDSRNLPNSTPNNCARPVTPPTWPAGSQPPIDAEPPHPLSTPPQGGRQPRPQFAEPVYRGQSPEQAPRTDLWWTQPRTARRPVVSAAQPTPTQYAQPTAAPQQVAPNWSAPAAAPTHYAATPAPQPAAAVAPPAGNAYSQFAAPAQYAATPYGGNQYAASPYAAAPRATQPTAAPGYQAAPQYQPLQLARTDPYQTVRGQSPAPAGSNAYAALPTGGATQPAYAGTYGGQTVQPTNPASAPIRDAAVQPTQYSSQIQPPAGSIAPTPLSPMGALPGYVLFPDGRYGPVGEPYDDQAVDIFIDAAETQTGRLQMGFGVNSDAGVVGNFVVDERNFDWRQWPTSFEDFRNGQAFRGDGQRFRLEASPGSQVNRYLASFQDPYFLDRPIMLGLSGSFFDRRYSDWDEQRLGGRISLGYQWVERDLSASLTYRGENVNIRNISNPNVADLEDVVGDNVIHGFGVTVINDTRDSSFLPTRGYYVQLSGEQVIGSYIYPRATAEMRKYWRLTERPDHSGAQVLSFSTNVGWTGGNTPIFERFYAGGFATFRGFNFRGASPVRENVEVGGGFQWLNSVQYLFPLTADDMLHGVAFCDFGTVEENVTIKNFRVAPGVGLRITVPAMGPAPIALDFAWAVSRADTDDPQVFSFSIGFSR
ncbi:MAG: BamA/TamA family outer membrane protein, partial [Planctomycetales bacterium]|nr:BamA/TamA family outer membrane protein [Planctomycetales bacterium]